VVALSSQDVYRACGILHGLEPGPLQPLPSTEDSALRTRLNTYGPEQIQMLRAVFPWLDDEYDKIPVERSIMSDPQLPGAVLRLPPAQIDPRQFDYAAEDAALSGSFAAETCRIL